MDKKISKTRYIFNAFTTFAVILIIWILVTEFGILKPIILPKPISIVQYWVNGFAHENLMADVLVSLRRIVLGFLASAVVAVPLGILAGTSKLCDSYISPICEFMRYLPIPTLVPLVMVWFGIGESAKVILLFLGCVFQLLSMVADAANSVSDDLMNAGYTLGASKLQSLWTILLPAALPRIFESLRMTMGWAWSYLTLAELFAANTGLGYQILKAQRFMQTDAMFGLILLIGFMGLITDRIFALVDMLVFHWKE
ncbi:MAG: ABC transporter permease [Lachnospiraceae bacterium]|nr:ABC transporter permease [Lachnospiraceae bacterium]